MLSIKNHKLILVLASMCFGLTTALADAGGLTRVDPEFDESTCLCGLSREIMDRLESLLQKGMQTQSCPATATTTEQPSEEAPVEGNHDKLDGNAQVPSDTGAPTEEHGIQGEPSAQPVVAADLQSESKSEPELEFKPEPESRPDPESDKKPNLDAKPVMTEHGDATNQTNWSSSSVTSISVTNEHAASSPKPGPSESSQKGEEQNEMPVKKEDHKTDDGDSDKVIEYLATEIHRLESLMLAAASRPVRPASIEPTPVSTNGPAPFGEPASTTAAPPQITSVLSDHSAGENKVTITISSHTHNSGFLGGLADQNSLVMLNQSQTVQPEDMASALESTIPSVVSNIFTNIQNLTESSDKTSSSSPTSKNDEASLTSIDGSKVNVSGSTSAQITAEGEKLFQDWIEHQLRSLHLTAAMAGYIRKNAINLFRRIARQYMERVGKMGGSMEDNVRKATQIALNNTEHLSAYLMKNYINFAGGLMQIIGEQVSRVGKQLDSTGDTISHISLNPFDIVSNVIDSLPNPSDYSKYFRAFGKQLLGETNATTESPPTETQVGEAAMASTSQPASQPEPKRTGLFKKTMGALTKSIGWLG